MIAPIKDEIRDEMKLPQKMRKRIFNNPQAIGIELQPKPCILIRVEQPPSLQGRLKKMNKNERKNFMAEKGRRTLGKDSMVLFCDEDGKVMFVGVITRRDDNEFTVSRSDNNARNNTEYFTIGIHII